MISVFVSAENILEKGEKTDYNTFRYIGTVMSQLLR